MEIPNPPLSHLRKRLTLVLANGMAKQSVEHARQVAEIASILYEAFQSVGLEITLVGGSAIEIHAPGSYVSGDLDMVLSQPGVREIEERVFRQLGFTSKGRHWVRDELFVETPPGPVAGPASLVQFQASPLRVVDKEVPLRDRIVGFRQWGVIAYGIQAIQMLASYGDDLAMPWLEHELRREGSLDAFHALRDLHDRGGRINETTMRGLLNSLRARGSTP